MSDIDDLLLKAARHEAAKVRLLIAVADAVAGLLSDKADEWDSSPAKEATKIRDLIGELNAASKPIDNVPRADEE